MTKAPGAFVYMPPEALEAKSEDEEMARYNVTIDVFSFGVLAIFTLSQTFPCNLLAPTYRDERRKLIARTELERRDNYMQKTRAQLRKGHPLVKAIEQCLENSPDAIAQSWLAMGKLIILGSTQYYIYTKIAINTQCRVDTQSIV